MKTVNWTHVLTTLIVVGGLVLIQVVTAKHVDSDEFVRSVLSAVLVLGGQTWSGGYRK